jgi:hypothetical protein
LNPIGHGEHVFEPVFELNVPGGHWIHKEDPDEFEYVPTGHAKHDAALEYDENPAEHAKQVVDVVLG